MSKSEELRRRASDLRNRARLHCKPQTRTYDKLFARAEECETLAEQIDKSNEILRRAAELIDRQWPKGELGALESRVMAGFVNYGPAGLLRALAGALETHMKSCAALVGEDCNCADHGTEST